MGNDLFYASKVESRKVEWLDTQISGSGAGKAAETAENRTYMNIAHIWSIQKRTKGEEAKGTKGEIRKRTR